MEKENLSVNKITPDKSRRSFLKKVTIGSLALSSPFLSQSAPLPDVSSTKKTPVVDMHIHCFAGPADTRFPYHEKASYKPAAIATPEHL